MPQGLRCCPARSRGKGPFFGEAGAGWWHRGRWLGDKDKNGRGWSSAPATLAGVAA